MTSRRSKGDRQEGAAAVELALVLPILLMLVFGIVDFGRAYNAKISLTQAAREGARVESLRADLNGDGAFDDDDVRIRVAQATPLTVVTTVDRACSSNPLPTDTGSVTVTYVFSFVTPVGALAGLAAGPIGLSGTGVMRCLG